MDHVLHAALKNENKYFKKSTLYNMGKAQDY
jgi:hypothetical protein